MRSPKNHSAQGNRYSVLVVILALGFLSLGACASLFGPSPQPVTVPQIIKLSQDRVPPEQIIQKIQNSGMKYRLNDEQLAQLKKQGVSPAVINYMHQTYLDAVQKTPELQDWGHWTMYGGYWYGGEPFD